MMDRSTASDLRSIGTKGENEKRMCSLEARERKRPRERERSSAEKNGDALNSH